MTYRLAFLLILDLLAAVLLLTVILAQIPDPFYLVGRPA